MPSRRRSLRSRCASPGSSTGATRTAAARASTPGTSPASSPTSATRSTVFSGRPTPSSTTRRSSSRCRASTSTGRATRSGCRGRGSSATRIDLREFAHHVRGRVPRAVHVQPAGPRGSSATAAPTSTSSTTTSASAAACVQMIEDDGWPVMATLHHPITVDRDLDFAHTTSPCRKLTLRRWYGFLDMQMKVARQIPRLVTVSESSKRDIAAQMGVPADRLHIVPVGVDPEIFGPRPHDRARARPAHDHRERRRPDEGPRAAARGARQGAHRAPGRAPRGGRQAEGRAARSRR